MACKSVRASAHGAQARKWASTSSQTLGVSDPSIRSLRRFWYFSQFIVLTSDASHHVYSLGRRDRRGLESNKGETAFGGDCFAVCQFGSARRFSSKKPAKCLVASAPFSVA